MHNATKHFLFCLFLLPSALVAEDSARIEQLRNIASQWSTGLSSFSGHYTLYERNTDTLLITQVDFRQYKASKYVKVIYEDRNRDTIEESFHKGSFVSLFKRKEEEHEKNFVELLRNQPSFSVPESSLLTPVQFFFQEEFWPEPDSMAIALTRGHYVLRRQDENEILMRYDTYGCHDIFFDSMQRIIRIDVFTGLGASEMKFAQQMHLDFLELRYPYMTFVFDKFVLFKDVWFPLQVRHVTYRPNQEAQIIIDSLTKGEIDQSAALFDISKTGDFLEYKIDHSCPN